VEPETATLTLHHLIGQFGRALTPLRPSGVVDFEGRRLDGLAEEGLIPAGTLVKAISIRGNQLVVRVESEAAFEQLLA
jgi:membrane-bound serine protease (ClpP class)